MARNSLALARMVRRRRPTEANIDADVIDSKIAKSSLLEFITKLFSLLSVVTVSLALALEVGYFYGIDINLFTLFTLSEHILFTLKKIPLAFVVVIVASIIFYGLKIHVKIQANIYKRYSIFKLIFFILIVLVALAAFEILITSIFVLIIDDVPKSIVYILLTSGAIPIVAASILVIFDELRRFELYIFMAIVYLYIFVASFSGGYLEGSSYVSSKRQDADLLHSIIGKDFSDIPARIIRSGDKGVLFFDVKKKEVVFLKWDGIQEVRSRRLPPPAASSKPES